MKKTKNALLAVAASAALAATLGLAACGGTTTAQTSSSAGDSAASTSASEQASEQSSPAAEQASAQASSVEAYNLEKAWVGMGDDNMAYYYEGADKTTGAVLVYYTNDNTYERWIGAMEAPADDQRQITDAESGEQFAFTITSEDKDGTIEIKADGDFEASMSPTPIDEVGDVLDQVSSYASKVGEPAKSPSAEELGGEFVVQVNSEGLGQIAYTQDGESIDFADSAFTHADAGDTITLNAKAGDEWKFVKWTCDGKDFSTEAEAEVTVEGDVEYVAVFEMK